MDVPGSLPDGLRYVEKSDLTRKRRTVVATRDYDVGEEFGPFTGKFVKEGFGCCNPSTWEVRANCDPPTQKVAHPHFVSRFRK